MKRILFLLLAFVIFANANAQFGTATVDGTLTESGTPPFLTGEYGTHANTANKSFTKDGHTWYITWNNTTLFVGVTGYDNAGNALVLYLDTDPLPVVNGGTNANGSLTGTGYDGVTPSLPFRSDVFLYVKNDYTDYVYDNGSGGWGSNNGNVNITKAYNDANDVFEFSIPWNIVTNGGGRPASFNFLSFLSYSGGGGGCFGSAPQENATGTAPATTFYYTVANTNDGTATMPFNLRSFAKNSGSDPLTLVGFYYDFTLNNGCAITSIISMINVYHELTVTGGSSLNTSNNITLRSDYGPARLAAVNGTITGDIGVEKLMVGGGLSTAIPSKRSYRFMAHPFNTAFPLINITGSGEIDITGAEGSTNGFTTTTGNAPSAFRFDPLLSTSNVDPGLSAGWVPYTSATGGGSGNTWNKTAGLRVFYRGAKGEGLTNGAYTVGNATLSMVGALNIGNQTINLVYNTLASTGFNFIGNPYASNIDMTAVTGARLVNTTSSFYVWDITMATKGAYATKSFGTGYVLPAYSAIFVEATATGGSITFNETDKTAAAPTNTLLRNTIAKNNLRLQLKSDNILWDELQFNFDEKASATKDIKTSDAAKFMNPEVSLYSLSSDNKSLAIDNRALTNESIALGIKTNGARSFTLVVSELNIATGTELWLKDNYTNSLTKVDAGVVYEFTTDNNTASQGEGRFELVQKSIATIAAVTNFDITLSPNPTTDNVRINYTTIDKANTSISIANSEGRVVKIVKPSKNNQADINVKGLAKGIYYVTLVSGDIKSSQKLIIQ